MREPAGLWLDNAPASGFSHTLDPSKCTDLLAGFGSVVRFRAACNCGNSLARRSTATALNCQGPRRLGPVSCIYRLA